MYLSFLFLPSASQKQQNVNQHENPSPNSGQTLPSSRKSFKQPCRRLPDPKLSRTMNSFTKLAPQGQGLPGSCTRPRRVMERVPIITPRFAYECWTRKLLSEARARAGLSKVAEDSFFDLIQADVARLVRLRHPGVVYVVQALDENKNAMVMVTEPLFKSVGNALGNVENVAKVPNDLIRTLKKFP